MEYRRTALRTVVLLALPGILGCGGGRASARPEHPVVLIAVDGLEWHVLAPLLEAGRVPALGRLVEQGVAGRLVTIRPALSPAVWTTVATGVAPERHGVNGFLSKDGVPFTSASRKVRALWNIASLHGLRSLVVGWWATWPAEEIEGCIVAPYSSAGQDDRNWKGNLRRGVQNQTWPRLLIDEVYPLVESLLDPRELGGIDAPFFGGIDLEALTGLERTLVAETRWSVAADLAFSAVACHLLEKPGAGFDLTMVYIGGPDVASHRFWRYRHPEEFSYPVDAAAAAELAPIIERFYVEADRMIGRILAAAPANADVIVCSDHGFRAAYTGQPHPRGISAHHLDGPAGVVIAAGPDFGGGQGLEQARDAARGGAPLGTVYDVAPLALYLLGIPLAKQMESPAGGSLLDQAVRADLLGRRPPIPSISSHDRGFRPALPPEPLSEEATRELEEWLRQLGYLDSGSGGR